jgi:hypothetical protein
MGVGEGKTRRYMSDRQSDRSRTHREVEANTTQRSPDMQRTEAPPVYRMEAGSQEETIDTTSTTVPLAEGPLTASPEAVSEPLPDYRRERQRPLRALHRGIPREQWTLPPTPSEAGSDRQSPSSSGSRDSTNTSSSASFRTAASSQSLNRQDSRVSNSYTRPQGVGSRHTRITYLPLDSTTSARTDSNRRDD